MIAAGKIHLENGKIETAVWEFGEYISVSDQQGLPYLIITEYDMRRILTAYCESTPKTNDKGTNR